MKHGDVILSVDGREVRDSDDLRNRIAQMLPGTTARLRILRDGRERTISVQLDELEAAQMASRDVSQQQNKLGWEVQELSGDLAARFGIEAGVLISNVQPGSVAQRAGLQRGDVIVEINRQPVRNLREYAQALERVEPGSSMLLLIRRENQTFFSAIRMPR